MWKQIAEVFTRVFMLTQETQKNRADIASLQQEVKDLTAAVQRLAYELHRQGENEAHEREKMALRLENAMLRFERRLLSGKPDGEPSDPD